MPLLSPRAKVGSFETSEEEKVVPEAKPLTALEEKATWTSFLLKPALRSEGMISGVCARAVESSAAMSEVRWRKRKAMVVDVGVNTIKQ